MVEASDTPLLVLLAASLLGASRTAAVLASLIFTAALLFGFGWLAGEAASRGSHCLLPDCSLVGWAW